MTYVFTKISGIPEQRIIGSGTTLDTARLRYGLSEHYQVAQKNIHAYVFGEHGDTSFVPWSRADVSGSRLDEYAKLTNAEVLDKAAMEEFALKNDSVKTLVEGKTVVKIIAVPDKLLNIVVK